jgi:polyisoprenoid-binding protein YceI
MGTWPFSDDSLRAMYAGGRADATARRFARLWAAAFGLGLMPKRWVTLEIPGRRSGRIARFPLGMADFDGQWYLVPMLGEHCNWVQNVRAAGGRATLRHRRAIKCRLIEVPLDGRAPIIKRYLDQVPGARPHIPVGRHAPLADFEAISARYPVFRVVASRNPGGASSSSTQQPLPDQGRCEMTDETGPEVPARRVPSTSSRKHSWWRWILASIATLVVLVMLAAGIFIKLQSAPPPLALPKSAVSVPVGPVDGTWDVAPGSLAGFRVRESALGMSNATVGRTNGVTGAVVVSGDRVTSGAFRIGLATMKVGGKAQPQFAKSLDTGAYPTATFTLARPVTLSSAFTSGATITAWVTGRLALHGTSRLVTFMISGRRDGPALQVAGTIPVTFSEWGIRGPKTCVPQLRLGS